MHKTVLTLFRLFLALIIFTVTLSLVLTCFTKLNEIIKADQYYQDAKTLSLQSQNDRQFVLVSNNKKSDQAIFILLANQGYVSKVSCEHYAQLCLDEDNQTHTRQIQSIDLIKIGQQHYIQKLSYVDSRNGQAKNFEYSQSEIHQFYQQDVSNLKYIIFAIALFAIAALYVSFRILRNFKQFLGR
ncbi:hypothetical protein A3K93_03445 [Acinetobacter sp. NCu2D-2]|uniref:hypothetical protein n=1 Tax=Acinetobacter sp. NCu2D-2 TaxID=1608473 RepID=UPI0007CDBF64|nr:hypothetical protein [Acinetobacter sp. NCu2D-2]ANF81342.1 hypothetical protein A3K93_03445 [Acinetobacter sp. NCu2D-2]